MTITSLGHFTIRCTPRMLPALHRFYSDVLGLSEGDRPEFPFPGHWFYCGGKAIVHLAAMDASDGTTLTGPFDHVAFEADGIEAVRERLIGARIPFFERPIPGYPLQQLFARDPAGLKVEQTFAMPSAETAHAEYVHANGSRFRFEVTGTGPALLLLHGGAGSLRMFDRIVPLLSPHYRVIRYDQRDCGGSDKSHQPYDFVTLADDAAALLDALDAPSAHVFGTSFGGLLAQALALRHPRLVDRLVLSSTWLLGIPYADVNPQRASAAHENRTPEKLAQDFFSASFLREDADAARFFRTGDTGMPATRAELLKRPGPPWAGAIEARTLVVGGQDDRIVPFERSRELARSIRLAQAAEPLSGVGHVGVIEAPQRVAGLVRQFCV